jgi:multidrug efflux pump subunit AcrA (membrane-fusion protein)
MKRAQLEKMFGIAGQPWPTVTPDPEDTGDGNGGGGSTEDDGEDLALGEAGQKALSEERAQRKALSTELAQLKAQLAQMKNLVSPEVYAQAQAQATALQQQIADQKQNSEAERQRIETKANQRVTQAEARAQKAENDRVALLVRTAAQGLFMATGGRDGGDGSGRTYCDAWFDSHGKHHIRVDPTTGKAFVVDSDGDPVKDGEQNIDPVKWLNDEADGSQVVGIFFKPKGGSGGGGLQGARGVRSAQGLTPEQLRKLTPSQKMELHREASRR